MKIIYSSLFFIILLSACFVPKNRRLENVTQVNDWFPMNVGSYWVYADTIWKNDKVRKVEIDTVKVLSTFSFQGQTAYQFSNKTTFLKRNDSIYQVVKNPKGEKEAVLVYLPKDKMTFNCFIDGDNVFERKVKKYYKGYIFKDQCGSYTQIISNVGIRKVERNSCNPTTSIRYKRQLINYHLE